MLLNWRPVSGHQAQQHERRTQPDRNRTGEPNVSHGGNIPALFAFNGIEGGHI